MLHTYRVQEAASCLRGRRMVFIGGASTLNLFEGITKKFDPLYTLPNLSQEANVITTLSTVRLEFVWDPALDSSALKGISAGFDDELTRPAMTVIGLEHDHIQRETDPTLWAAHLGAVISGFSGRAANRARQSDAIIFTPTLDPNMNKIPEANSSLLVPPKVDRMNDVLAQLSSQYDVDVAFSFNDVASAPHALNDDLHLAPQATAVIADILLNLKCNAQLPKHYPYASTCCNTYPRVNWVQLIGFTFVAILIPAALHLRNRGYTMESSKFLRLMPEPKYYNSILIMGLAVVLCWYCDRTNVFGKEQKQTEASQFFVLMGLIIGASLYTLKKAETDLPFLNRDQTDEWKGWMQVAILVYHYCGNSKNEYIYNYMRVCPTSYLFMTGFGHTVYFLKKDDFSFKRFVATMLRLNLLNVILAYAMGNDWLLYYFAPLVTWNFFIIYGLLWVGHKYNKSMVFVYGKIIIAAALNTAFYRIPGVLEAVWSVLQLLFRMQGDMREWRFRITLDQYSIFPGMIGAIFFINFSSYRLPKSAAWPYITRIACAVSVVIMLGYAYFEATQPSKQAYNQKHTYVSWLPCCAFVILRNSTPWLRKTHNGFFAWVGRGSLETFLLQFHIWLAADTAGLLMMGPPHQRLLNVIITTPIFFYVASLVTTHTGTVIEWIMAAESKPARPTLPTSYKSHLVVPKAGGHGLAEANTRPGLPMSYKSHLIIPTSGVYGLADANAPFAAAMNESNAIALNGQPVEIKVQDPAMLEKTVHELESQNANGPTLRSTLSVAGKDLRVRVGLILVAMAAMNWVCLESGIKAQYLMLTDASQTYYL